MDALGLMNLGALNTFVGAAKRASYDDDPGGTQDPHVFGDAVGITTQLRGELLH